MESALYNHTMLRCIVLITMLLILPLQMSWAMAGAYCGHELGADAQHFGHHDHEHHDALPDFSPAAGDNDCGYHQQASPQWLPSINLMSVFFPADQHVLSRTLSQVPDSPQARPERPNWHHAA